MTEIAFIREINPETQRLLQRIYRQSRHHQVRRRAHCLLLRHQGLKVKQLMDIFPVSYKTIYNWFNAWETRGLLGLYNRPGRGRKPTFNHQQKEQLQAWAQEHPKQLKQVWQKVEQEWGLTISTKTIKRILKTLRMSWHRLRRGVAGQPEEGEYTAKQLELEALKRKDEQREIDLYYLDETGKWSDSLRSLCLAAYWPIPQSF